MVLGVWIIGGVFGSSMGKFWRAAQHGGFLVVAVWRRLFIAVVGLWSIGGVSFSGGVGWMRCGCFWDRRHTADSQRSARQWQRFNSQLLVVSSRVVVWAVGFQFLGV